MEEYPTKTVCTTLTFTLISYILGTIVLFIAHPIFGSLYLLLWVFTTLVSLRFRCIHCYYYGKKCGFGFSKLSKRIFKQGSPEEFSNPKNIFPVAILSMGTSLLPLIGGIIHIVSEFSLGKLILLISYFALGIVPNMLIRPQVCLKCKQGELGCPAHKHTIKEEKNK